MSPTLITVGIIVAFASGLVQGCTGFGMGLIASSSLMLFLPPREVIPIVLLMSTVNTALAVWPSRRHVSIRLLTPVTIGALAGLPLGVFALKAADPGLFKVCVGAFVTLFAIALLTGWKKPLPERLPILLPLGAVSGFLGSSTSMAGPPIILFLANQRTPKDVFRASLLAYFFILNCILLVVYPLTGLLTLTAVCRGAVLMPALLIGTFAGIRLSRHIPEQAFSRIAMAIVLIMGLMLLATGLRSLA